MHGIRALGWTAADEAESAVLVDRLVTAGLEHRDRCVACARLGTYCAPMAAAAEAVVDWHHTRRLLSRAQHLRHLQGEHDDRP